MRGLELDSLSAAAKDVLVAAGREAASAGSAHVGTEHLLIALCEPPDAATREVLGALALDLTSLQGALRRAAVAHPARVAVPLPTPRLMRVLRSAGDRRSAVEPLHLLAALLEDGRGPALDGIRRHGGKVRDARSTARNLIVEAFIDGKRDAAPRRSTTPTLDELGRDLTVAARAGKLTMPVGRDDEIRSLAQVLMHRTKANPVLVGPAGVGKTCIVEGLAVRAARADAAEALRTLRFVELPPAALVAGMSHQGDLEKRVRAIVEEVRASPDVVLFLDELHTLLYAGSASGGAANILKPALARSDFRCIGATTVDEYRLHVEKDGALARRFHQVPVAEPDRDQAIAILRGVRGDFEKHHRLRISDEALIAAVDLSVRFMIDRHLPDKALDLVDHACARRSLRTLAAVAGGEDVVEKHDIADALGALRGVQANDLMTDEKARLLRMGDALRERVVGQDEAVDEVTAAVQARMAGLSSTNRPVAVLLFAGPSGVGKTELAKALAHVLFGDEGRVVRIDMSEYSESHALARLIGAPPGYVGHELEGQLTGPIRTHPQSVVLFDELEKAHPKTFDLFLQIFDEGHLTDARGRRADFRNAVVIMTTNLGDWAAPARKRPLGFRAGADVAPAPATDRAEAARAAIERALRPELVGRIDKLVVFNRLEEQQLRAIALRMVDEIVARVAAQGLRLVVHAAVIDAIVADGDDRFGARHVRKAVDARVRQPIARAVLGASRGDVLHVDESGDVRVASEASS